MDALLWRSERVDSGPRGGAARHDVQFVAYIEAPPEAETDFEAWVAYRKAKKEGGKRGGRTATRRREKRRLKGMVRL